MRSYGRAFIYLVALITIGVLGMHPARAAGTLSVDQSCVGGKANVTFNWQGGDPAALQQWIDISTADNGWLTGTFISAGPFDALTVSYTWTGLTAARAHLARLNQQLPDGTWDASPTFRFTTSCGSAAPAPSTVPAAGSTPSYVLLGVSDHAAANNGPPDDIVLPGGTLSGCGIQTIYAYFRLTNIQPPKEITVNWIYNGTTFGRPLNPLPPVIVRTTSFSYRYGLFGQGSDIRPGDYLVRMSTADDGVVLEQPFKLAQSCP